MYTKQKNKNFNMFNKKRKNKNNKQKQYEKNQFKTYEDYLAFKAKRILENKKKNKPKTAFYLHSNKKLKQGIFLKQPSFHEIKYPFSINLKLINEYIIKN